MRTSGKPGLIVVGEEQLREMAEYCEAQADILALYLYGSHGTCYQTALSDVDLAGRTPLCGTRDTWAAF